MKQKLLSWLLCLGTLFAMLPVPTYAAGDDPQDQAVASVTVGETTKYYEDLSKAISEAQKAESAYVCILKSIFIQGTTGDGVTDTLINLSKGNITLEMAPGVFLGRSLSAAVYTDNADRYVIYNSGCTLKLINCRFVVSSESNTNKIICVRSAIRGEITVSDSCFFASGQCTVFSTQRSEKITLDSNVQVFLEGNSVLDEGTIAKINAFSTATISDKSPWERTETTHASGGISASHCFYGDSPNCVVCGYSAQASHIDTGGTATCSKRAVCDTCHEKYGELDPSNHSGETTVMGAKAATCTEAGYTGNTKCQDCGTVVSPGKEIPATGHKNVVTRNEVAATCTEAGYSGDLYCVDCEGELTKGAVIEALGHTGGEANCCTLPVCTRCSESYGSLDKDIHCGKTTRRNAKEATCTENGFSGDVYCNGCNTLLEQGAGVDALGHTGGKATCKEPAVCDRCHEAYGTALTQHPADKLVTQNAVSPTCTDSGYSGDVVCAECGEIVSNGSSIPATGHKGGEANCVERAVCESCKQVYGERNPNIHANLQSFPEIPATCTSQGQGAYTRCTGCAEYLTKPETIPALGHTGGEANCCTLAVCTRCSESYGSLNKDNHCGKTTRRNAKEATCTENGFSGDVYCNGCNTLLEEGAVVNELGHTGGKATCKEAAVCDRCHEAYGTALTQHPADKLVTQNAVSPTCTAPGYSGDVVCTECSKTLSTGSIMDAIGHTGGTATCISNAKCEKCHTLYGDYNLSNHVQLRNFPETPATCTGTGLTAYTQCTGCTKYISEPETIPALGHTGGEATCKAAAVCDRCGKFYGSLNKDKHSGGTTRMNVEEATCTENGFSGDVYCNGCNTLLEQGAVVNALGHTGGKATCKEDAVCDRCHETYGTALTQHPADKLVTQNAVSPTCTAPGYSGDVICTECGKTLSAGISIPATGHKGGKATCIDKAVCEFCKQTYGERNPNNHTNIRSFPETSATCTRAGLTAYTQCTGCTKYISEPKTIPALGHTGGEATCHALPVCTRCEKTYRSLDPSNHNGGTTVVGARAATCTAAGYSGDVVCAECGKTVANGSSIPATGHKGGKATCINKAVCETCKQTYGERNPNNHTNIRSFPETPATCTGAGLTAYTQCTGCTKYISEPETIHALGHTGGEATCHAFPVCTRCEKTYGSLDPSNHNGGTTVVGARAATCIKSGYTGNTCCLGCGAVLSPGDAIAKTEHKNVTTVNETAATCTKAGYAGDQYCSDCNTLLAQGTVTPALNHFGGTATCKEAAVCTRCGASYGAVSSEHSTLTTENAVAPSCTRSGYTGDEVCIECGHVVKNGITISAFGHQTVLRYKQAPTCTDTGYTGDLYCSSCNTTIQKGTQIPAVGHTGGIPTCTVPGVCVVCHSEYQGKDSANHTGDTKTVNACEPTVDKEGYSGDQLCSDCGAVLMLGRVIPALGHQFGTSWKYDDTLHWHPCEDPGYEELRSDEAFHSWDNGIVTQEPQYGVSGIRHYTCSVCGAEKDAVIPALSLPIPNVVQNQGGSVKALDPGVVSIQAYKGYAVRTLWVNGILTELPADGLLRGIHTSDTITVHYGVVGQWETCQEETDCLLSECSDLQNGTWYHDGVHYCLETGLMQGTGSHRFEPEVTTTRAMVVMILYRIANKPDVTTRQSFSDVPQKAWYADAVAWAAQNGIVNGYGDGRFGPDDPITREQMAAILYRFADSRDCVLTSTRNLQDFEDYNSISAYAEEALCWANTYNLIRGVSATSLAPEGAATRAQVAAIFQRFCTAFLM